MSIWICLYWMMTQQSSKFPEPTKRLFLLLLYLLFFVFLLKEWWRLNISWRGFKCSLCTSLWKKLCHSYADLIWNCFVHFLSWDLFCAARWCTILCYRPERWHLFHFDETFIQKMMARATRRVFVFELFSVIIFNSKWVIYAWLHWWQPCVYERTNDSVLFMYLWLLISISRVQATELFSSSVVSNLGYIIANSAVRVILIAACRRGP